VTQIGRPLGSGGKPLTEEHKRRIKMYQRKHRAAVKEANKRAGETRRGRHKPYWMTFGSKVVESHDNAQAWLWSRSCPRCGGARIQLTSINEEAMEGSAKCEACLMALRWYFDVEVGQFVLYYRKDANGKAVGI